MGRHPWDLAALVQHVVDVALLRRARVELALDPVEPGFQERRLREVRVAGGVDGAELEAAATRDADEGGAVLPAVVLVDWGPEPEVPEALVRIDRRGGDAAKAAIVVKDPAHELKADLRQLRRSVCVVEDIVTGVVDEREVVVRTVRRDTGEGLRHEARDHAVLARDGGADLAIGREVVRGAEGPVEEEVELELSRRVLVIAVRRVDAELLAVIDDVENDVAKLLE